MSTKALKYLKKESRFIFAILLKIVAFFIFITGLYYLVYLLPLINSAKVLSSAKNAAQEAYFILSANRVSFTQLAKLDPVSPLYTDQKDSAFARVVETQEKSASLKEVKINTFLTRRNTKSFINNEFIKTYPELIKSTKAILEKQKQNLDEYKSLDGILGNIYLYNPETDLKSDDFSADREKLAERAAAAAEGLGKISDNLDSSQLATSKLIGKINYSITLLNAISVSLNKNQIDSAQKQISAFIKDYSEVKKEAAYLQTSTLTSNESVKILLTQTQLLQKYEELIAKIEEEQRNLKI
ncbi:hypothetical protein A2863_04630 [Candidatus Woesebacteria bacterium RIFCSPHIGHO2_01_FULL_38_9b]|uniref:Uncharacterized protein n=1 Tax=Candidatus Woesebacteria bacterium RIFCSPHIGHO2_01_FULL_38_9b TaxID=1802493 RepID=A0A1F7Y0W9_9BACT|nr:MAG: hypothetical protein A2863_04630 [Candidatus Woesebacteria bacterium RIFCSPHIGHO2_01_FULL_38_9b]